MNLAKQLKTISCIANRPYQSGRRVVTALAVTTLVASCATGPKQYKAMELNSVQSDYVNSAPAELRPALTRLYSEGRRNEVLNHMEVGLTAYRNGHLEDAKRSFDSAILNINSVYADNEAARKARSLWYEEGGKDFKGEPYERAMVFFYRGLIYLSDGDYENARASFINGIMQDAFAEEEQHSSDFALFLYLAGWSAQKMGSQDLATSHFEELKRYRPDVQIPDSDHDVLVVAETGTSPRKLADGVGHYQLVYRRGKGFKENRASISYAGLRAQAYPMEDIFYQASTRGGRAVDKIIEGKVRFKQATENFGSTLSNVTNNSWMGGYAAAQGSSGTDAFAAVTMVSVAAMAMSANAKPRADTRYWSTLSDTVHVKTLKSRPGATVVEADFSNVDQQAFPELAKRTSIHFDKNGIGIAYLSSR